MQLMLHRLSALLGVQLLELMVACGVDPEQLKQKELDENPDGDKQATDTTLTALRKVQAQIRTEDGLTGVEGHYGLVNCTGHVDAHFDSNKISLPETAVGCRVAVESLDIEGRSFELTDAHPEWKTGDVLHFKASDGSMETLDVKVDHQLGVSPKSGEQIIFTVSRGDAAPAGQSKTLLAAGMEGTLAPNFKIRKTEFVGLTDEGAGQFLFHLDCTKAITVVEGQSPSCNGMELSSIRYQLIRDDFESELTFGEADALFAANPGQAVDAEADFEPFKAERKQFGGFQTQSGANVLTGPSQIHENPHMILLLQGPGPSYQYFNVDVVFSSN